MSSSFAKHPMRFSLLYVALAGTSSLLVFFVRIGLLPELDLASITTVVQPIVFYGAISYVVFVAALLGLCSIHGRQRAVSMMVPLALGVHALVTMAALALASFSSLPFVPLRLLGVGETTARIEVSRQTCNVINAALGQRVCDSTNETSVICPVMIRSRIGSEWVLDFAPIGVSPAGDVSWVTPSTWIAPLGGPEAASGWRRLVVSKPKLLDWQPLEIVERRTAEVASSTVPRIATWLDLSTGGTIDPALARLCSTPPVGN